MVADIATSSSEQALGISQINSGIEQIDQSTQINTASAEASAEASEQLSEQAEQLRGMISQFKLRGQSTPIEHDQQLANTEPVSLDWNQ